MQENQTNTCCPALPAVYSVASEVVGGSVPEGNEIASCDVAKPLVVLGIDTESYTDRATLKVIILSYQYYLYCNGHSVSGILYPPKGQRFTFKKLAQTAFRDAVESQVLNSIAHDVIVCAHFLKADLFTFENAFEDFQTVIKGIRQTVAGLDSTYGIDVGALYSKTVSQFSEPIKLKYDDSPELVRFHFYDTMNHAPAGKTLADVGLLLGNPKLEIPEPYSIEAMNVFMAERPEEFEAYAINDARISVEHFLKVNAFAREHGFKSVPHTIGGLAVKLLMNSLKLHTGGGNKHLALFGYQMRKVQHWVDGKSFKKDVKQLTDGCLVYNPLATACYHGGRNECFMFGPTHVDDWNDFDVPSCYTAIMAGMRVPDYQNFTFSRNVEDFLGDVCGVAWVDFEFPHGTRFPCLPVRTESYGLIYPLSGTSYCTALEIMVAVNHGAKVNVRAGFIVPWQENQFVFKDFMQLVREMRLKHAKGSFEERYWKEIGNSLYGKLGQGLKGKKSFDVMKGYSTPVGESDITNPLMAAYVTGAARALLSEMLIAVPAERSVVSVTTDGFLTNARLEEIDLNGPVSNLFRQWFHLIDPKAGEILEQKHGARQILAMKTRGQITSVVRAGHDPVLAKAGVQVPRGKNPDEYMRDLFLNRVPKQRHQMRSLSSLREMYLNRTDLTQVVREQIMNLEFDHKRVLINPRLLSVCDGVHIRFETLPHPTVEEMISTREIFDGWRTHNVLKTVDDYNSWVDYLSMRIIYRRVKGISVKRNERSDGLMLRMFLRLFAQDQVEGQEGCTYAGLVKALKGYGYEVTETQARNSTRQPIQLGCIPVTVHTQALAEVLRTLFPDFDPTVLFVSDPETGRIFNA